MKLLCYTNLFHQIPTKIVLLFEVSGIRDFFIDLLLLQINFYIAFSQNGLVEWISTLRVSFSFDDEQSFKAV